MTNGPATELILGRLKRVRRTGPDSFAASCPGPLHANGDRHPSLHVKDNSGSVLLYCFAGCDKTDILKALDLKLSDLFDHPRSCDGASPLRSHPFPRQAVERVNYLVQVIMLAAVDLRRPIALSESDMTMVLRAFDELETHLEALQRFARSPA